MRARVIVPVIVVLIAAGIPRSSPAVAATGEILFYRKGDVFSRSAGSPENLTNSPTLESDAEWSPDGTQILFDSVDFAARGNTDIYVADADGSNLSPLIPGAEKEQDPSWSPDGSQIAFAREDPDGAHIYTAEADGSSIQQLTEGAAVDYAPEWSPDGTRIVFTRMTVDGESRFVVVHELATGNETALTPAQPDADASYPRWSPDGNTIAFQELDGLYHRIVLMDSDGSNDRLIGGVGRNYPVWSPDGTQIAYMKMHRLGYSQGIFVMDLSGKVLERIAPAGAPTDWRS